MRKSERKGSKGQSLVETALMLPVILLILTGIIDFSLMLNNYLVIENASREAARYAAVGYTDSEIEDIVTAITGSLDPAKMSVTVYPAESLRRSGEEVSVTVEYDNDMITPVISAIIPNPVHVTGKTVMRVE